MTLLRSLLAVARALPDFIADRVHAWALAAHRPYPIEPDWPCAEAVRLAEREEART